MEVLAIDLFVTFLNVMWAVHEQLRQSNESTWWKVQLLKLIKADSVFHQWNRQGGPHVLQPFLSFLGKFLVSLQRKLGNLSVVTITKSGLYSFQEFLSPVMIEQRKAGITDLHVPYMISDIRIYICMQLIVFERADLVFVFNFHPKNTYEGYVTQFSDL